MNDLPFEWIPGELVEQAYVEIDGVKYYVIPARYADGTSLSAYHFNKSEYETLKRVNGTILWQNPNPNAEFQSQNITLNSNDYDCYEIIYLQDVSTPRIFNTGKILKGHGTILDFQAMLPHYRAVNYVSDTTLQINEGVDVYYTSPASTVASNTTCVPLYIIGYKTGLFGGQS
jgi:hypothetical protein